MITRRYEAETLNEALVAARAELGDGVVVLHSKRKVVGGIAFLGNLFGRECYEVLVGVAEAGDSDIPLQRTARPQQLQQPQAAAPSKVAAGAQPQQMGRRLDIYDDQADFSNQGFDEPFRPPPALPRSQSPYQQQPVTPQQEAYQRPNNGVPPPSQRQPASNQQSSPPSAELADLRQEILALKESMSSFSQVAQAAQNRRVEPPKMDPVWGAYQEKLTRLGIEPPIVQSLLEEAQNLPHLRPIQAVRQAMTKHFASAGGVQPHGGPGPTVCVFVGPTGVGKTTSIAKIAAGLILVQNYQVCLASADTYRIAAVEQLRVYAEIIGAPLEVLYGAEEVPALLAKHANTDIILVDTAGRSPKSKEQMRELMALVEALNPDEVHFVVAANLKPQDSLVFLENFPRVANNRLLVTKLDETQSNGVLLNLAWRAQTPFSYITMGQSVPDDITEPAPGELSAWILGEEFGDE